MGNGNDLKSFSILSFSLRKMSTGRPTKQTSMLRFFWNRPTSISSDESDIETDGPNVRVNFSKKNIYVRKIILN